MRTSSELTLAGIAAGPESLAGVRNSLRDWLQESDIAEQLLEDILLATYEASANAVVHAYDGGPGVFDVVAVHSDSAITVTVTDYGRWSSAVDVQWNHGRGLPLIHALADRSEVSTGDAGSRVRMTWECPS